MLIIKASTAPPMIGTWNAYNYLRPKSFQCIIFSPPYYCQRMYNPDGAYDPNEFGLEDTLASYLLKWRSIATYLLDLLVDDGTLWVNIGESNNNSGGPGGDFTKGSKKKMNLFKPGKSHLSGSQEMNVPARVSMVFQDSGLWNLRKDIIWDKGEVERADANHIRRPKRQHEHIYMFCKSSCRTVKDYKFYPDRLAEPGDVWHFGPNRDRKNSHAPFPDELAERCVLPSTDPGDKVLDIFSGSHTTARVAEEHGRLGVGVDLYAC